MVVNYKEVSTRIKRESPEHASGAELMSDFAGALQKQGLLPERLPEVATPALNATAVEKPILKTPEAPVEIKRFSVEQREALEKQGHVAYDLTGQQSIRSLRNSGHKFWSDWHKKYPDFEDASSMISEVAINRKELFLPKSQNKTFDEQVRMVGEYSRMLGSKIPGVETIMGQAADYAELAFVHLDKTQGKDYLFGVTDNYYYTRTKTPTVGSGVAIVGHFDAALGLDVDGCDRGARGGGLGVAPLVVPTSK